MNIIYEGVDITDSCKVRACETTDRLGKACDSLRLQLYQTAQWSRWKPKPNDKIEISHKGYSTGLMFVDELNPDKDGFVILARSVPHEADTKAWTRYRDVTLGELARRTADALGFAVGYYGATGEQRFSVLTREDEPLTHLLYRAAEMENCTLKITNGAVLLIDKDFIADTLAARTYDVPNGMGEFRHELKACRLKSLTLRTVKASATATDDGAQGTLCETRCNLPADDAGEAARRARATLRSFNEQAEELSLNTKLDVGIAAGTRIDCDGNANVAGKWYTHIVTHDLRNGTTRLRMRRVIETIR